MWPIGHGGFLDCSWEELKHSDVSTTTTTTIIETTEQTINDFQKMGKLGGGTYGDVFRVRHRITGEIFALKQIRDEHEANGVPATAMREAAILKQLNHPSIIRLRNVFITDERCCFLLDYMQEDLKRYLDKNRPMNRRMIKSFMYQLLDAIYYCHRHRVIHRDIKPHNILVDAEGRVKMCDFGLARVFTIPMKIYTHEIVTLWYRAPEILLGSLTYGTPVDMWSLGCIFGEMYQGWPLFHGDSEIDEIFQVFKLLGTPTEDDWPNILLMPQFKSSFPRFKMQDYQLRAMMDHDEVAYDLLKRMLTCDPTIRLAARYALRHGYLAGYDRNTPLLPTIQSNMRDRIRHDENNNSIATHNSPS